MIVVTFDLDDTLYREQDYVFSGFHAVDHWLHHRGIARGFAEIATRVFESGTRRDVFDHTLTALNLPSTPKLIQSMVKVYRDHVPSLKFFPDALRCLDYCSSKEHIKLALITDGYLEAQRQKAAALKLDNWFDPIVFSDELGREFWKPHPAPYRQVMKAFQNAAHFVYIGDNVRKDFITARTLGWTTVHIRREGAEYGALEASAEYHAHKTILTLDEVPIILEELASTAPAASSLTPLGAEHV